MRINKQIIFQNIYIIKRPTSLYFFIERKVMIYSLTGKKRIITLVRNTKQLVEIILFATFIPVHEILF